MTQHLLRQDEPNSPPLDRDWLRNLALACGADDAGCVSIDAPELDDQRADILSSFPRARTLVSLVGRTNLFAIRSPLRSVANSEFHHSGREVDEVGRKLAKRLNEMGIGALNEPMAFPMEVSEFPAKTWIVSHKQVAVAAGLGQMGIHRNVIHPRFGSFILLGSVVLDRDLAGPESVPLEGQPCVNCMLCVAACPVGAIETDGTFHFSACMTHNYREFMGGFVDWVQALTESTTMTAYEQAFDTGETVSLWQSLSYGPNYKAAYCIAVCPAGEDVISPFLKQRPAFIKDVLRPLQDKPETIYVLRNSDAAVHVQKRFPHKTLKYVGNQLKPRTIKSFLSGLPLIFQPGRSKGIDAVFHFSFSGKESAQATVTIQNQKLTVSPGHIGKAALEIRADSETWLGFVSGRRSLTGSLLRRKIRFRGDPRKMQEFARCLPTI